MHEQKFCSKLPEIKSHSRRASGETRGLPLISSDEHIIPIRSETLLYASEFFTSNFTISALFLFEANLESAFVTFLEEL